MDMEASIVKRLQKLKQWQLEQQERLLKQQQIQREILSSEKDRICKALGLPIYDLNISDNTDDVYDEIEIDAKETMSYDSPLLQYVKDSDGMLEISQREILTNINTSCEKYKEESAEEEEETETTNCTPTTVDKNINVVKHYNSSILLPKEELSNDLLIEGIKPLSSDNMALHKHISIDDIPLPSPKKDFHTLLEEKLKREEVVSNAHREAMTKPKKPFLKKGQGLSRYKMSVNSHLPSTTKKYSTPLSLEKKPSDRIHKSKKSVHKKIVSESPNNVPTAIGRQQLNLKAVPLPRKIVNKCESVTSDKQVMNNATSYRSKHLSEMSDFESKTDRELEELEEVRIFELLEEKAENSSFCSTSSTVLAFLQQSTPFKIKKTLNYAGSEGGVATNVKQQNDKRRNDAIQQELIVQRSAHMENFKSPRVDVHKRSRVAAINSCWETIGNTQKEAQEHLTLNNQDEYNAPIIAELSSDSEEISMANNRSLARDNDTSHHVRFSEYNEYRTIDLIDTSDPTNKSPFEDKLEQQDSDNNSFLSSESSDVEEKVPEDYKEQMSSLKIIDDEETVDEKTSRRLSLQQDLKDLFYHALKTFNIPKEESASSCKDGLPDKDTYNDDAEEIVQTFKQSNPSFSSSDSSLSSSSSSSSSSLLLSGSRQELSMREKEEYTLKNEKSEKVGCLNAREDRMNFEPELLKSRLLELEREIDIFRKESAALLLQRRKLQEEQTMLRKEYVEKERTFEEDRRRVQNQLEEERKKLGREKVAMESRIRDAQEKARQNKMERQRAQDLQDQLKNLRDDMNVKESRWSAAESRYKSELRVLRMEISKLKQEVTNLQNVRRVKNTKNIKKNTKGQVIAKAINQINTRVIAASSKKTSTRVPRNLSDASSDAFIHKNDNNDNDNKKKRNKKKNKSAESKAIDVNNDFKQIENNTSASEVESKQIRVETQSKCSPGNIAGKKNLYKDLLKDATSDLAEDQGYRVKRDTNNPYQQIVAQMQNVNVSKSNKISGKSSDKSYSSSASEGLGQSATIVDIAKNTKCYTEKLHDINEDTDRDQITKNLNLTSRSPSLRQAGEISPKDVAKQVQHSDGRVEYWYPNGNVRKIFPDQGITKMIYYNGDVREVDKDGKVKYFYSTSRTWCTMTPDGLQILEFPNGQVEKRTADGTVEVLFPDGAVKIVQADGMEKWSLPDGTTVQIFANGDKVLTLPNGQREIHTKDLKKREYPDGTVKLVYADGSQETRYSSGRKRLKDKDGNLLLDYYDN